MSLSPSARTQKSCRLSSVSSTWRVLSMSKATRHLQQKWMSGSILKPHVSSCARQLNKLWFRWMWPILHNLIKRRLTEWSPVTAQFKNSLQIAGWPRPLQKIQKPAQASLIPSPWPMQSTQVTQRKWTISIWTSISLLARATGALLVIGRSSQQHYCKRWK